MPETKKSERYPSPFGRVYDPRVCQECGAIVDAEDLDRHDHWHERVEKLEGLASQPQWRIDSAR